MSQLRNEMFFGARSLMRENWLGRRLERRLSLSEQQTPEQLLAMQQRLLHRSLTAAISSLPYYAGQRLDFAPEQAADVLRSRFPVVDKMTLREHSTALYPAGGRPKPWQPVGKTSGTTGSPLVVFRSMESVMMENAFIKRHWGWSGYRDGMRRATLRGDIVAPLERRTPPYWFYNRYDHQLLLSSRHLLEACVDPLIDELERFQPHLLQAYPSTAYALAQFLQRRQRYLKIPFLFSASEPLYPHQRELIVERLGCTVMDMYGMAERVAFATQCEHGSMHINPDYSYVEILDDDGKPTDGDGYIVGTTLHNLAMPLVRYRLSDRSRWRPGACPCGRHFPMIEAVTGKLEDAITGGDGESVSPSVLTFAFKGVSGIRKSQVAQIGPAHWEIRLVPDAGFSATDEQQLRDNVRTLVDSQVKLDISLHDSLPNTAAGKFRWVVNEYSAGK